MKARSFALFSIVSVLPASAQQIELRQTDDQPYFRYEATVQDTDGGQLDISFLLAAPSLFANVTFKTSAGLCVPVCVEVDGGVLCLKCTPTGGGPTLSAPDFVVLKTAPPTMSSAGKPGVEMSIGKLSANNLDAAKTFQLQLNK